MNFRSSGNVKGKPIMVQYPSKVVMPDSNIMKIVMSIAPYHMKFSTVMSGASKNKFNRLGVCATDPSRSSILDDVVNVVSTTNSNEIRDDTAAVEFKNIRISISNFVGSCTTKLNTLLGENTVTKIY